MTMNQTGSLAQFEVNGKPATSTSNQVTGVIPGVTLNLNSATQSTDSATITVAVNSQPITTALQNAVSQYNALATQVGTEFGTNAGALNGNSVVLEVQNLMRQFAFYTDLGGSGSGGIQSLSDLGISIDKTGQMSIDTSVVSAMSSGQLSSALSFIGNSSTGLAALASSFTAYSDTTTGLLQQQVNQDQKSEQNLQNQIDALNTRIAAAQKAETARVEAADSLLAQLESHGTRIPNNGSWHWRMDDSLENASTYQVRVTQGNDSSIYGTSSAFSIIEIRRSLSILNVSSPIDLNTISSYLIDWSSTGPITNVDLYLWNTTSDLAILSLGTSSNIGSWNWNLPNNLASGNDYAILIKDSNSVVQNTRTYFQSLRCPGPSKSTFHSLNLATLSLHGHPRDLSPPSISPYIKVAPWSLPSQQARQTMMDTSTRRSALQYRLVPDIQSG